VYYLPGWAERLDGTRPGLLLAARNTLNDTIIVIIDGYHENLTGTLYGNSPVSGYWEDYIMQDLIPYIDEHYSTINSPDARGIAGFSMGGVGCINLAFKYPDTFGAVYSISPAIYADNEIQDSSMNNELVWDDLYSFQEEMIVIVENAETQDEIVSEFNNKLSEITSINTGYSISYGFAFAHNLSREGVYFDFLYTKNGSDYILDSNNYPRWENGGGNLSAKVTYALAQNPDMQIGMYYGNYEPNQWIKDGVQFLSDYLTDEGISHQLDITDNAHGDNMIGHYYDFVSPFFQENLSDMIGGKSSISSYPYVTLFIGGLFAILLLKYKFVKKN
jgi:pimeloyl-ACP methyl ester carboxylesterase